MRNWYDLIKEAFIVGTYDDGKLGLCVITTLGVTDYSKPGEKIDFKGGECLGVSEWYFVGILEGIMLCNSSKLWEEHVSKEDDSRGVSELSIVGIPEVTILGTNVVND